MTAIKHKQLTISKPSLNPKWLKEYNMKSQQCSSYLGLLRWDVTVWKVDFSVFEDTYCRHLLRWIYRQYVTWKRLIHLPDARAFKPEDQKVNEEIPNTLIVLVSEITFTDKMPQYRKHRVQSCP